MDEGVDVAGAVSGEAAVAGVDTGLGRAVSGGATASGVDTEPAGVSIGTGETGAPDCHGGRA